MLGCAARANENESHYRPPMQEACQFRGLATPDRANFFGNITKLSLFEGLTRRALGDIICPMKSEKNSARVGTVIARQISCQMEGADFGNIHNYFGNISLDRPPYSRVIISLLIRWANQFNGGHYMSKYTPCLLYTSDSAD